MIKPFEQSYLDYHTEIESSIFPGIKICEIGPSGHPSIRSSIIREKNLDYSLIDIETTYWNDYNPEIQKYNIDLQSEFDSNLEDKFDLVISQMVLEHIEDPENFHKGISRLLRKEGRAIHLYANPFSLSAIVNRILPESIGEFILKIISNRNLEKNHKYPAFYRWCYTPSETAIQDFAELGFEIQRHVAYLGHNYFQRVPLISGLEKLYSRVITKLGMQKISTLSLLIIKKK